MLGGESTCVWFLSSCLVGRRADGRWRRTWGRDAPTGAERGRQGHDAGRLRRARGGRRGAAELHCEQDHLGRGEARRCRNAASRARVASPATDRTGGWSGRRARREPPGRKDPRDRHDTTHVSVPLGRWVNSRSDAARVPVSPSCSVRVVAMSPFRYEGRRFGTAPTAGMRAPRCRVRRRPNVRATLCTATRRPGLLPAPPARPPGGDREHPPTGRIPAGGAVRRDRAGVSPGAGTGRP